VLLAVFSVLTAAVILLGSLNLTKTGTYEHSYPKSLFGAIGCLLAAVGMFICAYNAMGSANRRLDTVTFIVGFIAAACMLATAYFRFSGKKCPFILHTVVAVYLALRTFNRCQMWSNEPQVGIFIWSFLASLSLMLAMYQRLTFDVDLGDRKNSVFWSLTSAYLCIVSMADQSQLLFFGCMTVWMLADLPSLRALPVAEEQPVTENE
jgi:hypothetical protein